MYAKLKTVVQNIFLLIVSVVFFLWLIEISAHFLYPRVVSEQGKQVMTTLISGQKFQATGHFVEDGSAISEIEILPYYLYRNKPNGKILDVQQINSEGYRNGKKEFGAKDKNTIRILTIGGSTTFGWLIKDYQDTWPTQLEKILNEKSKKKVEVINAGLPGGNSAESLISFMLRDKYLEPDIVIFHNGGNDAGPLLYDNYYPDYRYFKSVSGMPELRPGELWLLQKFNIAKLLYGLWLKDSKLSFIRGEPNISISAEDALTNAKNNQPVGFKRNMDMLIRQTKELGATPILFPFYLAEYEVFNLVPEGYRYAEKIYPAISIALEKNKAVLRELAKEYNVNYLEMPPHYISLDYFFDHCHLKPPGDEIKATFLAERLLPILNEKIN